jgi:hypothetical protein
MSAAPEYEAVLKGMTDQIDGIDAAIKALEDLRYRSLGILFAEVGLSTAVSELSKRLQRAALVQREALAAWKSENL